MKSIRWSLSCALLLASVLVGCTEEDTDAIVDVRWAIGGTNCVRAGVDLVYVSLVTGGEAVAFAESTCDAGEVSVTGVAKGRYTVQVFAFRLGEDTPAFMGQEAGIQVPKGGRVTTPVIFLQDAPGAVDVTWRFEGGGICGFEGAEWVQIAAFDERNRVVADIGVPCDPGVGASDGMAGPGSEYLEGAIGVVVDFLFEGPHQIIVVAYRDPTDSDPAWGGEETVEVRSFELSPVEIVLTPCTDDPDTICF